MLVIDAMDFEDPVCVLMHNSEGNWGKKKHFRSSSKSLFWNWKSVSVGWGVGVGGGNCGWNLNDWLWLCGLFLPKKRGGGGLILSQLHYFTVENVNKCYLWLFMWGMKVRDYCRIFFYIWPDKRKTMEVDRPCPVKHKK